MKLKTLSIGTLALFLISVGVYVKENYKSSDLVAGSYVVSGLDVEKIHKIVLKFAEGKELVFVRDQNTFAIENHKSYPASIKKINDLIFKVASLKIKERVSSSSSAEDLKNFELAGENRKYLIEFFDNSGRKRQSIAVGKRTKGGGHYVVKENSSEVFLSDGSLWLESSYLDFIDRVLVEVEKDKVEKLSISGPEQIEITKSGNEFDLIAPQGKEEKKDKLDQYLSDLKNTRFDEVFKHDDEEVKSITFKHGLEILTQNKVKYSLQVGEKSGKYFVKASALATDVPEQVVLHQDSGADELKSVGDMIQARQTADNFNLERGAWVYQLDEANYNKLIKKSSDFL